MRAAVAIAILLLVAALAALVGYILLRRLVRGIWNGLEKARSARLAAEADAWLQSDPEVQPEVLRRILPFPDRGLFVALCLERLPDAGIRDRARLVGWLESQGQIDRWIRQLTARSHWRRARAAELLGIVRAERSVAPLVAALQDPVFDVRMRAAKALGALGGSRARAALVGALADENRWSTIRISDLLAEMGPDVVHDLIAAYPRMTRGGRLATLDVIAHVGDDKATPFLVALLEELDRDIRSRAASALGRIGDGRARTALAETLQDCEWPVRAMCAKALGRLGTRAEIPALRAAMRDPEWWVRANAAESLGRLGTEGRDELISALDDHDSFARDQALATLEGSGELNRQLAGLISPAPAAADAARRVLDALLTRQSRDRVRSIGQRHPDAAVRAALRKAVPDPSQGALR